MSAAERASSQSRSSPRQQRDEGRVEEDGHSRLSSDVTFDLLVSHVDITCYLYDTGAFFRIKLDSTFDPSIANKYRREQVNR